MIHKVGNKKYPYVCTKAFLKGYQIYLLILVTFLAPLSGSAFPMRSSGFVRIRIHSIDLMMKPVSLSDLERMTGCCVTWSLTWRSSDRWRAATAGQLRRRRIQTVAALS